MRIANRAIVAGGVGVAASLLVACGSGGGRLLSGYEASSLDNQLDQITVALADHDCGTARTEVAGLESYVRSLSAVNQTLVANLEQGATTVADLLARPCPPPPPKQSKSKKAPKKKTKTTSTSTTTTPTSTSTTPSTTAPPPATSTATTPPPPGTTTTTPGTGGVGLGGGGTAGDQP